MPVKDPVLEDLGQRCKAAGLGTGGNRAQLNKRLQDLKEYKEGLLGNEDDSTCDAILATKAIISSDEGTKTNAKVALVLALEEGELEVERVRGEIFAGNCQGLGLADMKQRFLTVESELASLKEKMTLETEQRTLQMASHAKELAYVNEPLSTLTLASREYRQVRERFICIFRRDVLKNETAADRKIIQAGNVIAHGGDAAADALLYDGFGGRNDAKTFIKLYGMAPSDVQKITHKETLMILDIHAEVIANTSKTGTDEFYAKFQVFIDRFEDSNHDENYLNSKPETNVTTAYWDVRRCKRYVAEKGDVTTGSIPQLH